METIRDKRQAVRLTTSALWACGERATPLWTAPMKLDPPTAPYAARSPQGPQLRRGGELELTDFA